VLDAPNKVVGFWLEAAPKGEGFEVVAPGVEEVLVLDPPKSDVDPPVLFALLFAPPKGDPLLLEVEPAFPPKLKEKPPPDMAFRFRMSA